MIAGLVFLTLVFGIPAFIIIYNDRAERRARREFEASVRTRLLAEIGIHRSKN